MTIKHDLDHEVYVDPKDHKEHINHGMLEYTEEDLKTAESLEVGGGKGSSFFQKRSDTFLRTQITHLMMLEKQN